MDISFKIPPKSPAYLTDAKKLHEILKGLIGKEFKLTSKQEPMVRTYGNSLPMSFLQMDCQKEQQKTSSK